MGRAPCCDKNGLKKGPWTPEEDQKLVDYIQKHGYGNWRTLPKNAGLQRCGKSCRLRWTNYLRPDIKRGRFSFEEEETIIQLHSIWGNKWSAIAARLPGRTDNEIKNYWNTHIRKRLLRMGIDPVTHSPRLDLLDLSSILSSSLYSSSDHMNMSRMLGVQPLVNPGSLLRLATSLLSSQRDQTQSFVIQSGQEENHLPNPQVEQSQYQSMIHQANIQFQTAGQEMPTCTTLTTSPCVSFSNEARIMDPNVDQYQSSTITNFSSPNSQLSTHDHQWQSNGMGSNLAEDYYVPAVSSYNSNGYYGSDLMDPSSETSTFISNSSNQNFGFASVLSTPSSSPAPLNSDRKSVV